jgi:cysteinyl-tRNA synthetase
MLKFFNSLSKKKEAFKPLKKGKATVYNCGPTVYDYFHIGNLRYVVFTDLLRRLLDQRGYEVMQVMNITDVGHMLADADEGEDKMDVAAQKAGKTPQEVAAFYTDAFFRDIDRLDVRRAHIYPKASEHVQEMIAVISKLFATGHAYKVGENVYYDVSSFPDYGKLSGNLVEGLEAGARIEVREEKKNPADFALWIHNPKHLMQWEAPWGKGYPGWHIECSAMAMKYLGESIDLHTGGEDNKFPHHECEIAQSEGVSGKQYVRIWLHATHLLVDGEKMSKSKGNFYTLDDLLKKGYESRIVRYLLLSTHYRQSLNFTFNGLDSAKGALERLDAFTDALAGHKTDEAGRPASMAKKTLTAVLKALDDDMNIAAALAEVFDFVRLYNERMANRILTERERVAAIGFMTELGALLGFTFGKSQTDQAVPPSILSLIEKRDEARKEKRFAEADRIRDEIKEKGYLVEDTPEGRRIKKV